MKHNNITGLQHSVRRFIRRFLSVSLILGCSNVILIVLYAVYLLVATPQELSPLGVINKLSHGLALENGRYRLSPEASQLVEGQPVWIILLDNRQGVIRWSLNLPGDIPDRYTLSDIAELSRNYLNGYPVFTGPHPDGLLVAGLPKGSCYRISGVVPEHFILHIAIFIFCNVIILLLLYSRMNRLAMKSVGLLLKGVRSLSDGQEVKLCEQGDFKEIAASINKTSNILKSRSAARENWIAGISHDIRTPLSMMIGYADRIGNNETVAPDVRKQADIVRSYGLQLRELVNDLNLLSWIESDGHPTQREQSLYPASLFRQIGADFLNNRTDNLYTLNIESDEQAENIRITADPHLLQRALNNLLYNSVNHNPEGCTISFQLKQAHNRCIFIVSDNGNGISRDIQTLSGHADSRQKRQGLGLRIVRQIVTLFGGTVTFHTTTSTGFRTEISLPLSD